MQYSHPIQTQDRSKAKLRGVPAGVLLQARAGAAHGKAHAGEGRLLSPLWEGSESGRQPAETHDCLPHQQGGERNGSNFLLYDLWQGILHIWGLEGTRDASLRRLQLPMLTVS